MNGSQDNDNLEIEELRLRIFDTIRAIRDPEFNWKSLEDLNIVDEETSVRVYRCSLACRNPAGLNAHTSPPQEVPETQNDDSEISKTIYQKTGDLWLKMGTNSMPAQSAPKYLVDVHFTPTKPNCSMTPIIGLCIIEQIQRCFGAHSPENLRLKIRVTVADSHIDAANATKQLNDKERVAAAIENPSLMSLINASLIPIEYN